MSALAVVLVTQPEVTVMESRRPQPRVYSRLPPRPGSHPAPPLGGHNPSPVAASSSLMTSLLQHSHQRPPVLKGNTR